MYFMCAEHKCVEWFIDPTETTFNEIQISFKVRLVSRWNLVTWCLCDAAKFVNRYVVNFDLYHQRCFVVFSLPKFYLILSNI